jgi:Mn-dependent DtxR family transcriptional regulator
MYYKRVNEIQHRFNKALYLIQNERVNTQILMDKLGVSRPTVIRTINELRRHHYINVIKDSLGWRYEYAGQKKRRLVPRAVPREMAAEKTSQTH